MAKMKIKKGDLVTVIAGNDKRKEGKVLFVFPKKNTLIVEGVSIAKKTVKKSEKNPEGGFIQKELPIHISNVKKVEE